MVLAVIERRAKIVLTGSDVFTATVGGVKLTEPAGDLAVALAVASAHKDKPLLPGLVAVGEVGLAGEVRRVEGVGRRLTEAARLGFTRALVPPDSGPVPPGVRSIEVFDLAQAIEYALATSG
jgi:DNA repair protein RadA/Sms